MHEVGKVWVIFESPEDTNLPDPICACTTEVLADSAIKILSEKEPSSRYWKEELALFDELGKII